MSLREQALSRKALVMSMVLLFAGTTLAAGHAASEGGVKANLTPEDQVKGSAADVELTRKIRQELVNDKTLSTDAQNIKIITLNGVVTLRGSVSSAAEKSKVDSLAKKFSGVRQVDNQTEIKTKSY